MPVGGEVETLHKKGDSSCLSEQSPFAIEHQFIDHSSSSIDVPAYAGDAGGGGNARAGSFAKDEHAVLKELPEQPSDLGASGSLFLDFTESCGNKRPTLNR